MNRTTAAREESLVRVGAGSVSLEGNLVVPERARGVVLFAHGSGSGRHSPRNRFVAGQLRAAGLSVGYFGASTGGGAALVAAARRPTRVGAVVSRGGRPDLAGDALPAVRAPTLLLVGGNDEPVIGLNRQALARLGAPVKKLV